MFKKERKKKKMQPKHLGVHPTYIGPHLKSRRVNLVELVKVAVDNRVLRETVLGAGCHDDGAWHLLPSGSFVVDLQ